MSERPLKSLVFLAAGLLALSFSPASEAQTAAPKADAKPGAPSVDSDVEPAKKAALAWLALVDAGKFEATFDEAATSFQKAQKKADWAQGLGGARTTMGSLVSRKFQNHEVRMNLPNVPPGKYITVRFVSVFEKHKNGAESVTLVKDGTRGYRMMAYFLK